MLGLTGLVLVLLVVLQVVLRPAVLTGIVNRVAGGLVEGEVSFREVKAHVIKSFPFLHLEAADFAITYPHSRYGQFDSLYADSGRRFSLLKAGNQRGVPPEDGMDTLASFRRLDLALDYTALLKGEYNIRSLELTRPRIFAHAFDSTAANWDILPIGQDADTSQTALPVIKLHKITLTDRPFIVFTQPEDSLHLLLTMRRMALDGKLDSQHPEEAETLLAVDSLFVSGRLPADTVAVALERLRAQLSNSHISLDADARARLRTRHFGRLQLPVHLDADATLPPGRPGEIGAEIHSLHLSLSALNLEGAGQVWKRADGTLEMDVTATIPDCPLGKLADEFQENIPFLKKLSTDARISLDAQVKGCYGSGQTPAVEARLLVPPATVDYEGLGRKGRLAVDASITTDNLKEVHADVERLFADIIGARIDLHGSVRDLLGKDPDIGLDGSIHARVDSLTQAFMRDKGIFGTGKIDARLNGRARLSQLNIAHIGAARINCSLTARDLLVEMPEDSLRALLPQLDMDLATKANALDRNLKKGARVLALKADADTLDISLKDMFIRGGGVHLLLQNSAEIMKGGKDLTPLMGLLRVNNLRLKDADGISLGLHANTESFRIEPATEVRPSPRMKLRSRSERLRLRSGENMFALRDVKFDVAATRHLVRRIPIDTARFRRMMALSSRRTDDFASADIRLNLGESVRGYVRDWDIDGNLEMGSGRVFCPSYPLRTRLSDVQGSFDNDTLDLRSITVQAGASELTAQARLTGLRRMLIGRGRGRLKLKADVQSQFIDANQLLQAYAYHNSYTPKRTLADAADDAVESAVAEAELPDSTGNPLLVLPANLEVDFSLESKGIRFDSLRISKASAQIAMRQRTLQITRATASSNMGDFSLEGFYATRAKNDLKAGFDLHLTDITAEKVITLFPAVDSILPMLTSFGGKLNCEMAATATLDTLMNLVKPTIDGVLRISGQDLTLKDSKEFSRIAAKLMFKETRQARVDKMAVTGIVQNNILEVFPFVLDIDRYQLAASGFQHLDNQFSYHISVLRSPLLVRFGLNAWGPDFDHIHYDLCKPKYKNAQVPVYTRQLDTLQYSLVSAIHNIFELGVDRALDESRTRRFLSGQSPVTESSGSEGERTEDLKALEALREQVSSLSDARREALKAAVLRLEAEAALKKNDADEYL